MNSADILLAIAKIKEAVAANDAMQATVRCGSDVWHKHETIDDHLHDALAALGD